MSETIAGRTPRIQKFAGERTGRDISAQHVVVAEHERGSAVAGGLFGFAFGRREPAIAHRHQHSLCTTLTASPACNSADIPGAAPTGSNPRLESRRAKRVAARSARR